MLNWLRNSIDTFNKVVSEGNYRRPQKTWSELITGIKPKLQLPATSEGAVGTTMLDTGKMLGERFLWGFGIAAVGGLVALKWAALIFFAAGATVYTVEYLQAKKTRNDVITEINAAGQKVKGTRADLYHLRRAQNLILNVADNPGDGTLAEATRKILEGVKEQRGRVTVVDPGRTKNKDAYAFTEQDLRLMEDMPEFEDKTGLRIDSISLKPAWDSKRASADEVVERLAALEESLPADIKAKLDLRLKRPQSAPEVKVVPAPVVEVKAIPAAPAAPAPKPPVATP